MYHPGRFSPVLFLRCTTWDGSRRFFSRMEMMYRMGLSRVVSQGLWVENVYKTAPLSGLFP